LVLGDTRRIKEALSREVVSNVSKVAREARSHSLGGHRNAACRIGPTGSFS
jgi:hypothetical protein